MVKRHTLTHADNVYVGDAYYTKYAASHGGRRGVQMMPVYVVEFGAVDAIDADGVAAALTSTGSGTATLATALGSTPTFDVPRNVVITSTGGDDSGITFTITGTDEYGETLVEAIAGPTNNSTSSGLKAFKTITSVAFDGNITSTNLSIGPGDVLGLPVKIANTGDVVSQTRNGVASTGVFVAADTTDAATATTGDVRGTFAVDTATDGSNYYTVAITLSANQVKADAWGVDQYGG